MRFERNKHGDLKLKYRDTLGDKLVAEVWTNSHGRSHLFIKTKGGANVMINEPMLFATAIMQAVEGSHHAK